MLLEIVPTPATLSIRRYRAKKAANHPRAGFFGSGSPTSLKYKSPAARHGSAELRFVSSALPTNLKISRGWLLPPSGLAMPKHVPTMRPTMPVKTLSFHTVTNFTVVERMNVVPGFKTSAGQYGSF
jgi:hypothetical protein